MNRILTISEPLYTKLEAFSLRQGLSSIGELLELWLGYEEERYQRQQAVKQIDALRERLRVTYGEMNDSVELIREEWESTANRQMNE